MPCLPAGDSYAQVLESALLAKRKALQTQELGLQLIQQAHTALERAQPQRAVALEAEALRVRQGRQGGMARSRCRLGLPALCCAALQRWGVRVLHMCLLTALHACAPGNLQVQQELHDLQLQRRKEEAQRRVQQQAAQAATAQAQQVPQQAKARAAAPAGAAEEEEAIDLISSSEDEAEAAVPAVSGSAPTLGWLACACRLHSAPSPAVSGPSVTLPLGPAIRCCRRLCPWRQHPARQKRRSRRSASSCSTLRSSRSEPCSYCHAAEVPPQRGGH